MRESRNIWSTDGKGLEKAMELAAKAASNTPTTNFAVLHALPRIFDSDPASGLLDRVADGRHRRDEPGRPSRG